MIYSEEWKEGKNQKVQKPKCPQLCYKLNLQPFSLLFFFFPLIYRMGIIIPILPVSYVRIKEGDVGKSAMKCSKSSLYEWGYYYTDYCQKMPVLFIVFAISKIQFLLFEFCL